MLRTAVRSRRFLFDTGRECSPLPTPHHQSPADRGRTLVNLSATQDIFFTAFCGPIVMKHPTHSSLGAQSVELLLRSKLKLAVLLRASMDCMMAIKGARAVVRAQVVMQSLFS